MILGRIAVRNQVTPGTNTALQTPEGLTRYWYNFTDLSDNTAFNYNLGDDFGQDSNHVRAQDTIVYNDSQNDGHRNPHKSFGYLRTPSSNATETG